MLTRMSYLQVLLIAFGLLCLTVPTTQAQASFAELQNQLQEKSAFTETDFAALSRGETITKAVPAQDKQEVAVSGVINLHANADEFLRSYRQGLTKKNNEAVLQIGGFSDEPTLGDLQNLTLEPSDIEDLKACVVGNCAIRLPAAMIERFAHEVNWQASDYPQQATQLFKSMLVEYVRDYHARGEAALMDYNDKSDEVRVADEQRAISAEPGYLNDVFLNLDKSQLQPREELIVWSKIKLGLKPVIAINQITIYKSDRQLGPQVLAVSKQIYANHYFNSSLALTAFVTVAGPTSYLVYENRSRTDALGGPLGKLKRKIVEKKAVAGLEGILEQTKLSLEEPLAATDNATVSEDRGGWTQRLFGGIRPLLWFMIISGLIALFLLRNYEGRTRTAGVKLKPEER